MQCSCRVLQLISWCTSAPEGSDTSKHVARALANEDVLLGVLATLDNVARNSTKLTVQSLLLRFPRVLQLPERAQRLALCSPTFPCAGEGVARTHYNASAGPGGVLKDGSVVSTERYSSSRRDKDVEAARCRDESARSVKAIPQRASRSRRGGNGNRRNEAGTTGVGRVDVWAGVCGRKMRREGNTRPASAGYDDLGVLGTGSALICACTAVNV